MNQKKLKKKDEDTSLQEQDIEWTTHCPPPEKGYHVEIRSDDKLIHFRGSIDPRFYLGKSENQIWSAFYKMARETVKAYEKENK